MKFFLPRSANELKIKQAELVYYENFQEGIQKLSARQDLKIEALHTSYQIFPYQDNDYLLQEKFDILPPNYEKHLICNLKKENIQYPYFHCQESKNMTDFIILILNSYDAKYIKFKIFPYLEIDNQKIFLFNSLNTGKYNNIFFHPEIAYKNNYNVAQSFDNKYYNTSFIQKVIDFSSQCKLKDSNHFFSEYIL